MNMIFPLLFSATSIFAPDRFTVLNIAPCSIGSEGLLAKEMVEYRERTGNDVVLYSLTIHPQGYPAMKKAERLVESYRKLRRHLEGSGVKLGVLMQSTLGHRPDANRDSEPWMRSMTLDGTPKRFCPLDPGCSAYLRNVAIMLAKEKPSLFMLDDDVHANGTYGVECFCERHVERFNRENGTGHTPESLRAAVKASKPGDPTCTAFVKMQRDFVNDLVDSIRSAIDSVDPSIPASACMPTRERRFARQTARRIASKGQGPVLRISNAMYGRRGLFPFAWTLSFNMAMLDYNADIPYLLDETDSHPHNRWSLPARVLDMKLQAAAFCGLRGSKLWYCNAHKNAFPISRAYTDIMSRHRGRYSAIAAAAAGSELGGIAVPAIGGRTPWHPGIRAEEFVDANSWASGMAGVFGVPYACSSDFTKDRIYALAGSNTVECLSDAELREMFRHPVLVDGAAALELTRRGLSGLTGVRAERRSLRYNLEAGESDGVYYPFSRDEDTPCLTPIVPDAEIVTKLALRPFPGSSEHEAVAPAMVSVKNKMGGRAVVTAFHGAGLRRNPSMSDQRKRWFLMALSRLGWNGFAVMNDQEAAMLERRSADGSTMLAVFNTGIDELQPLRIRVPQAPKAVEALDDHGAWRKVDVKVDSMEMEVPVTVHSSNACILRIAP